MSALRPPDDEPIRVAAPRDTRPRPAPRKGVVDATDAGLTAIAICVICVVALGFLGSLFGVPIAGAVMGGVAGAPAGFLAAYVRYRKL